MASTLVPIPAGFLKADMHCHTFYSGKTDHMTIFEPMDSYTSPQRLYECAKSRGMDLVTITDHDSIDGCLAFLNQNPDATDFFIGEEVTVEVREFRKSVHVGVYGITEAQHREITYLKSNFDDTISYLRSEKVLYVMNHMFHCFPTSRNGYAFLEKMLASFDLFEGLNGALDEGHNLITQKLAKLFPGKSLIAGSDSHTMLRLGTCYTAGKARNKDEFLQQVRSGNTLIAGQYGDFHHMFNDAMGVYLNYFRDLVFRREIHIHWSRWKEIRNALGWVACLPIFFGGALVGLFVRRCLEKWRQEEYEHFIQNLSDVGKWNTTLSSPEFT